MKLIRFHWRCLVASGVLMTMAGCNSSNGGVDTGAAMQFPPENEVVATINGEAVSEAMLGRVARARGLELLDPAQRQQALDLLIETVLLAQDAIDSGALARPEVGTELDLSRIQTLAARNLSDARAAMTLTDDQLRDFYQKVVAQTGSQELHLISALYPDEAAAKAAASEASSSTDVSAWFSSAEGAGAQQVRDLGWGNPTQLPPELAQAALALADGGVTPAPIQTRFGWHVLHRVASRTFAPPAFEDVREGIRKQAGDKYLEEKMAVLRAKATISSP